MRKPDHDWEQGIDRAFYMPTRSDEGVRAFRNWLLRFAGGAPKWAVSCCHYSSCSGTNGLDANKTPLSCLHCRMGLVVTFPL